MHPQPHAPANARPRREPTLAAQQRADFKPIGADPFAVAGHPYALLADAAATTLPAVFPDIDALARRILRDRRGHALQLMAADVTYGGEPREVAVVYADDQTGGRLRLIGYAWLNGRPLDALRAALARIEPPTVGRA